jgi:hypothetical protein
MHRYLGATTLILISILVSLFYPQSSMKLPEDNAKLASEIPAMNSSEPYSVRWQILQKLDYKKNEINDETLKQVLDKHVKIPGFAVPLSDNLQAVSEFLLVPNQMACIHVPAPPPNLIVFVRLDKALKIEDLIGPLWVSGTLRLKTLQSVYGSSSFEMENVKVVPYEF